MHHTSVLLPNGSLLFCGGRTSPANPLQSFFQLGLEGDMAVWSCVQLDPTSDLFEPRWRHTSTYIDCGNGKVELWSQDDRSKYLWCIPGSLLGNEGVAIIGGCTRDVSASNSCYILNVHEWKLRKVWTIPAQGRRWLAVWMIYVSDILLFYDTIPLHHVII